VVFIALNVLIFIFQKNIARGENLNTKILNVCTKKYSW